MSEPLIVGRLGDTELSDQLLSTAWRPMTRSWQLAFLVTGTGTIALLGLIGYSLVVGVGVWGNNIPVAWGFPIINFVWWIGIGHAGTFISAILLLLEQRWRTSINRFAEAMTLFAVMQAAIFPVLHLGRPWFFYWVLPYPSTMEVWPQFRSALPWDAAAISTYFIVSLLFWYLGLIPDLAAARDRAPGRRRRRIYGVFALGWTGSSAAWRRYKVVYGLLAGVATALVISVHSIVSSDFATALVPGWHSTIFPPYFVAGAILSGFTMVLTLMIPARRIFGVKNVITKRHLDAMGKMTLVTAWILLYTYLIEHFIAWYGGNPYEIYTVNHSRPFEATGAWTYWFTIATVVGITQALWFESIRTNVWALWIISVLVTAGMWTERYLIVVLSLERDYLPSMWGAYLPTWVDLGILGGTLCFFMLLFLLFLKFVPFVPLHEVKELSHELAREVKG